MSGQLPHGQDQWSRMPRRHPADVTADRLAKHYEQWFDLFTPSERDHTGDVVNALREIAGGER